MKTLIIVSLLIALQGCNAQQTVNQFHTDLGFAQVQVNQLMTEVTVVKERLDSINEKQE